MELLEEITANSDLCVHIERELLKVCEMHVSLQIYPLTPHSQMPAQVSVTGHSLTGEFQGLPKDHHVQYEGTCMHRHGGR